MTTSLVVASNRADQLMGFLGAWNQFDGHWHEVIVVVDGPRGCFHGPRTHWRNERVLYWDDIDEQYGPRAWIFSRRDSGIKCFGFLKAIAGGAEQVIVLDDDCRPTSRHRKMSEDGDDLGTDLGAFLSDYVRALTAPPAWCSTISGMRLRGLPYGQWGTRMESSMNNLIHMGLWEGVPDVDAITAMSGWDESMGRVPGRPRQFPASFQPPGGIRLMHPDQFWPFCGMSFAFRREALPALYFPKMGTGSLYARFDDIWCGLLFQRLFAACGKSASVGEPFVFHTRASSPMANLRKEAPGIADHEHFWVEIAALRLDDCYDSLQEAASDAVAALEDSSHTYLQSWGHALQIWLEISAEALSTRPAVQTRPLAEQLSAQLADGLNQLFPDRALRPLEETEEEGPAPPAPAPSA